MAKIIVAVRHAKPLFGLNPPLSKKGMTQAKQLGVDLKNEYKFDLLFGSDMIRTTQTGIIALSAMGQVVTQIGQCSELLIPHAFKEKTIVRWRKWEKILGCIPNDSMTTAGYIRKIDRRFFANEAQRLYQAYIAIVKSMEEGQTALVVGHHPMMELALSVAVNVHPNNINDIGECMGWVITVDGVTVKAETLWPERGYDE